MIAVSGGVDSIVLLDVLSKLSDVKLIVAHFDHGMRSESTKDATFVKNLTKNTYNLPFESKRVKLGKQASEQQARTARYSFLSKVREQHNALAIITAHHQDDVIETMMINLIRGTGRKGLTSLKSTSKRTRPLLNVSKKQILAYAKKQNLSWREDSTNTDQTILRNYVRHVVIAKLSIKAREQWLDLHERMVKLNDQIDTEITNLLKHTKQDINRNWLLQCNYLTACELVAELLRQNNIQLSRRQVQDAVMFIKTGAPGSYHVLQGNKSLFAHKSSVELL